MGHPTPLSKHGKIVPIVPTAPEDDVATRLHAAKNAVATEYTKRHRTPWIIAYSGGKDSTLLLQLVWETMLSLPLEERKRPIHIISNDTLVESPLVIDHLRHSLDIIREHATSHNLPVEVTITEPCVDDTFWVNVIGRGYIPPTRNFRWCTDRMKIQPTNRIIERIVRDHKRAVLLIGTRKSESQNRRRRMEKQGVKTHKMNAHSSIADCRIFSPLSELTDNDVWLTLLQRNPPWGGSHRDIITLYKNAGGGECPLVLTKADAPSCGTTSPRFGCWTCTVIRKDKSLRGLIDSGHTEYEMFELLADFRDWLLELREKPENRMNRRRDGSIRKRVDGTNVLGPFRMNVRREILAQLRALEKQVNRTLICQSEREMIEDIWREDEILYNVQQAAEMQFAAGA